MSRVNGLLNIENSARHVSGKIGIYIFDEALIINSAWSVLTETEKPTVLRDFYGTETEIEPIIWSS